MGNQAISQQGKQKLQTKATCPVIAKLGQPADLQQAGLVWTTLAPAQGTWSRPKVGRRSKSALDTPCHKIITTSTVTIHF